MKTKSLNNCTFLENCEREFYNLLMYLCNPLILLLIIKQLNDQTNQP